MTFKRRAISDVQAEFPDVLVLKYEGSARVTVKGQCGHVWTTQASNLVSGSRCGVCKNDAQRKTIDEVQAEFPDVLVLKYENHVRVTVKGQCGHVWTTQASSLVSGSRCGICATYGYDRSKPGWLYFMETYGQMQIGITNVPDDRLAYHKRNGWELVDIDGPHDGDDIWARERAIKAHLKNNGLLIPGKLEDWHTADWEPSSLHEIEEAAR